VPYVLLGGTGFIGSRVAASLSAGTGDCAALGRRDCDLVDMDSVAERLVPRIAGSVVVYASGIPRLGGNGFEELQTNLRMIGNVLQGMEGARPEAFVFLSSVEVYGMTCPEAICEQTTLNPESPYAVGKVAAEALVRNWCRAAGVRHAVFRLPGVYGPGDKGRGFIPALINSIRSGRTFTLNGTGKDRRDYLYGDDVATAVVGFVRSRLSELCVNLATGSSHSLNEIVDRVFGIFGACPLERKQTGAEPSHLDFDVTSLRRALPELVLTSLEHGLSRYRREVGAQ
jgi:UDP-glucose 4-epimerase